MNSNCFPDGVCKLIVDYLPEYTLLPWINKSKLNCFGGGKPTRRNIKSNVRAGDFLIDEYLALVRNGGMNIRDYLRANKSEVCENDEDKDNRDESEGVDIKINVNSVSCDNANKLVNVVGDVGLLRILQKKLTHINNDIIWKNYDLLIKNNRIFAGVTDEKLIEKMYNDYINGCLVINWINISRQNNPLANKIIAYDYYNNNGGDIYWDNLCQNTKNDVVVDIILDEYKNNNGGRLDWELLCESDDERIVNMVINTYNSRDGLLKIRIGKLIESLYYDEDSKSYNEKLRCKYPLIRGNVNDEEKDKDSDSYDGKYESEENRGRVMKLNFLVNLYLETRINYMLEVLFHIKDEDIDDELANHMVEKHRLYFSSGGESYEEGENKYVYWQNFYSIDNDIICNYLVSADVLDDEKYIDNVCGIYNNKNPIVVNYIKDRFYETGKIHWDEISYFECTLYNSIIINEYYYNNGRRLDWYDLCGDDCDEIVDILVHEGKWNNGARLKYKSLCRNKNKRVVELLRNIDEGVYITRSGFQHNPAIFEKIGGDVFDILMSLYW